MSCMVRNSARVCGKTAIVGKPHADADLSMVEAWDGRARRLDAVRSVDASAAIVVRERCAWLWYSYTMVVGYAAFGAGGRGYTAD